jgi:hypothetical protein
MAKKEEYRVEFMNDWMKIKEMIDPFYQYLDGINFFVVLFYI